MNREKLEALTDESRSKLTNRMREILEELKLNVSLEELDIIINGFIEFGFPEYVSCDNIPPSLEDCMSDPIVSKLMEKEYNLTIAFYLLILLAFVFPPLVVPLSFAYGCKQDSLTEELCLKVAYTYLVLTKKYKLNNEEALFVLRDIIQEELKSIKQVYQPL